MKNYSLLCRLFIILLFPTFLYGQTPLCGGSGGSSFIQPSASNVNVLMIYVSFPSGGPSGTDEVPSFASSAAEHHADYFDEMSYNSHHVNVEVLERPSPNQGLAFEADNSLGYYAGTVGGTAKASELNTEILDKAYAENNNVFDGISAIFMFIGGGIFSNATAWAELPETSSHYSGCGAMMEWGYFGSDEDKVHKWHMAHEYGHLLSPDGTSSKRLRDQASNQPSGIYNIMHYEHFNETQPMPAFLLIYLGWIQSSWIKEIDPTQSGDQSQAVTIADTRVAPSAGNYNVARIKIPGGATNEHFIIENRQGTGSDAFLSSGGKGLIIWHLNKSYATYNFGGGMDVEIATAIGDHGEDWLDNGVGSGEERGFTTDFFNPTNKSQFTPWTNPSTETGYEYSGSHTPSGLAITNIDYGSGTAMEFEFVEDFGSGQITEDSWWDGTIEITGDVIVESGATLTIDPGTTISFASGSTDLWVEGQIIAEGTAGNPITFTAQAGSPSRSEWGTIFVESDDNVFEYCTIEYSDWGIIPKRRDTIRLI